MIENLELKLSGKESITRKELIKLIDSWGRKVNTCLHDNINIIKCEPKECYDLSNLDVSQIKDFSNLFRGSLYNGDLSNWNTSNVNSMTCLFDESKFNNNSICNWNTSNVESMNFIFSNSNFNGDISNWDFTKITMLKYMFLNNNNFSYKYNNKNKLPIDTKETLEWLDENKEKMKEINTSKEEILDFFNFEEKKIKNDLI